MNCAWVRSQITLYLYNELDDPERMEIEQHAEACEACAAEIGRERKLVRVLDQRERAAVDPGLLAACRTQLAEKLEREPRGRVAWWRLWAAVATLRPRFQPAFAVLLLLAGFAGGWAMNSYRRGEPFRALLTGSTERVTASGLSSLMPNISAIHAINHTPDGDLEVVLDTTRRRVVRGSADELGPLLVYASQNYSDPGIRLDSIELLKNRVQEHDIRTALISAVLRDQNTGVRLKALEALKGFGGDAQVKEAILGALRADDNPGVRIAAIDQLSKLRDASTVPMLQQLAAGDPNNYVRLRSASALRDLNAPEIY